VGVSDSVHVSVIIPEAEAAPGFIWKPAEERRRLAGAGVCLCHHCRKQQQAICNCGWVKRAMTVCVWLQQMHLPNPVWDVIPRLHLSLISKRQRKP
jgi:hypothetical protein